MNCSNCGDATTAQDLTLYHGGVPVGAVCAACIEGVRTARISISRRSPSDYFVIEGYHPSALFNPRRNAS